MPMIFSLQCSILLREHRIDTRLGMRTRWISRLGTAAIMAALTIGSLARADNEGAEKTKLPVSARIALVHKMANGDANPFPIGNVIVKYADGTEDQWTLKGNCSDPQVSPSGMVGWIVYALQKDGKSIEMYGDLAVNGKLTICDKGKVLATVSTTKAFILQWGFAADGAHFVTKSQGAHGETYIQLFPFKNGPAEATATGWMNNLPDWASPYKD
jgi:hypothetical protein